jgi:hypothetical protein
MSVLEVETAKNQHQVDLKVKKQIKDACATIISDNLILDGIVGPHEKFKGFAPFISAFYKDYQKLKDETNKKMLLVTARVDKIEPQLLEVKRNGTIVPDLKKGQEMQRIELDNWQKSFLRKIVEIEGEMIGFNRNLGFLKRQFTKEEVSLLQKLNEGEHTNILDRIKELEEFAGRRPTSSSDSSEKQKESSSEDAEEEEHAEKNNA